MADTTNIALPLSLIGDAAPSYAYIGGASRSFGTIIPDIVVRETHHDHLTITKHPVEIGAAISDHCYKEPPIVEMECGCSNSTAQSEGYVQSVYQEILALQAKRQPFSVSTGKRQYSNMLIGDIVVVTDEKSEHALHFTAKFQNVIIVSTQTTSGTASNDKQANPASTGSGTNAGNQSLIEANGVPSFASASGIDFFGASTVPNGVLGSEITPTNVNTGGIVPSTDTPLPFDGLQPLL
jgi:hypothetical protein